MSQKQCERAIEATRKAPATGRRENREKRLVIMHIALEMHGLQANQVPTTPDVAKIIKKMVLGKKSPEKAAEEVAKLVKENLV